MRSRPFSPFFVVLILVTVYYCIAQLTFALRHPWMTSTERFLHQKEAITFQTVPRKGVGL